MTCGPNDPWIFYALVVLYHMYCPECGVMLLPVYHVS